MNRLFEETNRGSRVDDPSSASAWSPAVDIHETDAEIVVQAELPGMDRKDIELNLENNVLILRGIGSLRKRQRTKTIIVSSAPMVCSAGLSRFQRS